jgi:hypothetical protein
MQLTLGNKGLMLLLYSCSLFNMESDERILCSEVHRICFEIIVVYLN